MNKRSVTLAISTSGNYGEATSLTINGQEIGHLVTKMEVCGLDFKNAGDRVKTSVTLTLCPDVFRVERSDATGEQAND